MPWRSAGCSSPTRIFRSAFGRTPPSTSSTDRPPMAAAPTATRIIRRSMRGLGSTDLSQDQALPIGHAWLEIITRPSQEAFASAFTNNAVLDTSVASGPIVGPIAIRAFFDATRAMYEQIAFVHETRLGTRTHLEWEGKFAGRAIAGTTILAHDAGGSIESIRLYHRPYEQVISFAAELARRLAGKDDHGPSRAGRPMRLPPIHPTDLDTVQRELYDDIRAGIANGFNA